MVKSTIESPRKGRTLYRIGELAQKAGVRILGPTSSGPERVGTVSFVHPDLSSQKITAAIDRSGIAIRHGHMYAYHLCEAAGLDPADGVVRTSLVHYNTPAEIERLCGLFDQILPE